MGVAAEMRELLEAAEWERNDSDTYELWSSDGDLLGVLTRERKGRMTNAGMAKHGDAYWSVVFPKSARKPVLLPGGALPVRKAKKAAEKVIG